MQKTYDVIVSGAGPSGAMTATLLAQKGFDVLLLDRDSFPRDKTCGDAVPAGAIDLLVQAGMGDKIQAAVQRGELYSLEGLLLMSPKGSKTIMDFPIEREGVDSYVAPRIYFDAIIQQHAIDSGAEFRQMQVKKPLLENGRVVGVTATHNGTTENLQARFVVGADGVTSRIARALRPKENQHVDRHRAVALRAYIEDIKEIPRVVEFYFYKGILPGYAWIFPLGNNRANIGLGMRLDHFRKTNKSLEDMLQEFLAMPEIKDRLMAGGQLRDVATWQLNFGSQKKLQHVYDGAILVGDAAGFINPLTGGGIHNGLQSAVIAAQTIEEAFKRNDMSAASLKIYESRINSAFSTSMTRSYRFQQLLLRFPVLVDFLVNRFRENSQLAKIVLTKL